MTEATKKRNLAEIDYYVKDAETVVITGFRNFLSYDGMEKKYGNTVMRNYTQKGVRMYALANGQISILGTRGATLRLTVGPIKLEDLGAIVLAMREAGSNLVKAIREARQVQTIVI